MSATIAHVWIGILVGVSFVAVPALRHGAGASKEARHPEQGIFAASSWVDRLVWLGLAGAIVLEGVSWWPAAAMSMIAAIFFYQGALLVPRFSQLQNEGLDGDSLVRRHQILDALKVALLVSLAVA